MAKKFVLVAIGGSGMRVAQSVVALAASGMLTDLCGDDYRLEIRMVDLDIVKGGDKDELEEMIKSLNAAMPFLSVAVDDGLRKRNWKAKKVDRFAEFSVGTKDNSTLDLIVTPGSSEEEEKLTFHALYDTNDRIMELQRGCKGNPRIGSLLWAKNFHDDWGNESGFWHSIFSGVGRNDELRVMFAGSVFGGTGASGTPTLARLYQEACKKEEDGDLTHYAEHIGLTLMLPYFNIDLDTEVDSSLFPINSKMALKYYKESDALNGVEYTQFVGDFCQEMQKKKTDKEGDSVWEKVETDGKRKAKEGQDNPSMPAELMAAIGVCRYFAGDYPKNIEVSVPLKTRTDTDGTVPSNGYFPLKSFDYFGAYGQAKSKTGVKDYILRLERFYLMLNVYYQSIASQEKLSWRYRPEAFRAVWGKTDDLKKIYEETQRGVAVPKAFASSMFRWLEELDHHGMHELLEIEGSGRNDGMPIEKSISRQASDGTAAFTLCGIPGAEITASMNSMKIGEHNPANYFVSSLMECCVSKDSVETNREG